MVLLEKVWVDAFGVKRLLDERFCSSSPVPALYSSILNIENTWNNRTTQVDATVEM